MRQVFYTGTGRDVAKRWQVRATRLRPTLRAAMGQCGALVHQRRLQLLDETIYNRPPGDRPLSGNLRRAEFIRPAGAGMQVGNTARYAKRRHSMTGVSRTYPHLLDSHWASRAVRETAAQRSRILRAANRTALQAK